MNKALRAYMQLKGVTQEYVAREILGISPESFNNKINGRKDFWLLEAKKIADYFGKTIEEIFFNDKVNF